MNSKFEMVAPSPLSLGAFVGIVALLSVAFVIGVRASARSAGRTPAAVRSQTLGAVAGLGAWLAITGALPASGVLASDTLPPRVMLFMLASLAMAVVVAASPVGRQLATSLPIAALVLVQAFRLPLELILHAWADAGVLPVQMTFEGHNFDIVSGVLALVVGLVALRGHAPLWLLQAFNTIGFALLVTVTAIAATSAPTPLRRYMSDPPVLLPFHFPTAWIAPICVGGALLGHILLWRRLRHERRSEVRPSAALA